MTKHYACQLELLEGAQAPNNNHASSNAVPITQAKDCSRGPADKHHLLQQALATRTSVSASDSCVGEWQEVAAAVASLAAWELPGAIEDRDDPFHDDWHYW